MKQKLVLAIAITLISSASFAQSFDVGALGAFKTTWLFNKNISDAASGAQDYVPAFGYNTGVCLGINLTKKIGFELDYMYGIHQQSYEGMQGPYAKHIDGSYSKYESTITIPSQDIAVIFRLGGGTGAHLELGVQTSIIGKAKYNKTHSPSTTITTSETTNTDVSGDYTNNITYGLFGISMLSKLGGPVYLNTGLRFLYSLGDPKGVDAGGFSFEAPPDSIYNNAASNQVYENDKTMAASASFIVGITIKIGDTSGSSGKKAKKTNVDPPAPTPPPTKPE